MVRVGILGTSAWTERMYAHTLKTHPHAELVAVCGRDSARTQAFAVRNEIAHAFTDAVALLDTDLLDAVIISTPHDTHYPLAQQALNNGLHVFCEKPLAMTYAEADALATLAEQRARVNRVGFTYTYFPMLRYAARLIADGYIGQARHFAWGHTSGLGLNGDALWRFDRRFGGEGALADIGSHGVAVARMLLGAIRAVSAQFATQTERPEIPAPHRATDYSTLLLTFANGARGTLHVDMATFQPEGASRQSLDVLGDGGALYYRNDFSKQFSLTGANRSAPALQDLVPQIPAEIWHPQVSRQSPHAMYNALFNQTDAMAREFISAIVHDSAPNGTTFRDGAAVQQVLDAATQSAAQHGVEITLEAAQ